MTKIAQLTPEQEAELPRFRQRYLDLACNGSRIDRGALESALADAYAVIGKEPPKLFIFDSPAACMLALKIFAMGDQPDAKISLRGQLRGQLGDQLRDQLGGQLWGQLGDQLGNQLRDQLGGQLWGQLRGQLWDQLRGQLRDQLGGQLWGQLGDQLRGQLRGQLGDQLRDQLGGQLWGQLGDQLRDQLGGQLGDQLRDQLGGQLGGQLGDQLRGQLGDQLRDQLGDQLRDQLWDQLRGQLRDQLGGQNLWNPNFLWGSQDLYWIAWGRFAQRIGVKLKEETDHRLGIMERIAEQCEWWWPHEGMVVASQKPIAVRWDNPRRLHAEDRAAAEYADGYSLYAWHGVRLPERWVLERETINPTEILKEPNVETRAAGAACVGWPRMLSALDYRVIDSDPDPSHGELIELKLEGLPRPGRFLKAECPRNGTIVEGVPFDIDSVIAAQAWRVGLTPSEFSYPEIRT